MLGFAPLRVGIGYSRTETGRDSFVAALERAQLDGRWVFPDASEDLVLLGYGGMPTPNSFLVLHRPRNGPSFQPLGTLGAPLALEAVVPGKVTPAEDGRREISRGRV